MRLMILILIVLLSWVTSVAQPCKRLDIQDKKPRKILKRFIHECKVKGFLKPDSGLIHLSEWIDSEGQTNWQVWAQTTWKQYSSIASFRGHCTDCIAPIGWTKVANRLVLRYKLDQSDTLTVNESNCLKDLLASYVTLLPPLASPPKWVPMLYANKKPILDEDGKPVMIEFHWDITAGGGEGNNTHVTFKKNGLIEKGLSL